MSALDKWAFSILLSLIPNCSAIAASVARPPYIFKLLIGDLAKSNTSIWLASKLEWISSDNIPCLVKLGISKFLELNPIIIAFLLLASSRILSKFPLFLLLIKFFIEVFVPLYLS